MDLQGASKTSRFCKCKREREAHPLSEQICKEITMLWFVVRLLILQLVLFCSKVESLRISSIEVPPAVMNSSQVTLICTHDLQGDQLYSVKWYKNYVEFYRFQPNDTQTSSSTWTSSEVADSKHEFELDGIKLNLAKSNATHVYLHQTNLASEGTYKCEISADSPSFATVSIERQMKVYVLPKQKLSIVDNTISDQRIKQPAIYTINDLINLTCSSAPSRPAAKLSWFINDSPVASSSKWLWNQEQARTPNKQQLIESKLTLAFRLQPGHLLTRSSSVSSNGSSITLKFRCIAKLSVEFSTETKVIVSGGHNSPSRRRHQPHMAPLLRLPTPSSLQANRTQDLSEAPLYRWPRPQTARRNHNAPESFSDAWLKSPASEQTDLTTEQTDFTTRLRPSMRNQYNVVVWTERQLQSQADHIDQMLRLTRPNQLELPLIEAQLIEHFGEEPANTEAEPDDLTAEQNGGAIISDTELKNPNFDYELNDLVQFTCQSRTDDSDLKDSIKSVNSKWFINNKEILFDQVNAFDGINFYHSRNKTNQLQRAKPSIDEPEENFAVNYTKINNIKSEPNQQATNESSSQLSNNSRPLFIEFTSSLFQLKEFSLKCKTIVEQPLIEYESQWLASMSTNQFIQVDQQQSRRKIPNPGKNQKQNVRVYASNGNQQSRNRNGSIRNQQQKSSSSTTLIDYSLLCLTICFMTIITPICFT